MFEEIDGNIVSGRFKVAFTVINSHTFLAQTYGYFTQHGRLVDSKLHSDWLISLQVHEFDSLDADRFFGMKISQ